MIELQLKMQEVCTAKKLCQWFDPVQLQPHGICTADVAVVGNVSTKFNFVIDINYLRLSEWKSNWIEFGARGDEYERTKTTPNRWQYSNNTWLKWWRQRDRWAKWANRKKRSIENKNTLKQQQQSSRKQL